MTQQSDDNRNTTRHPFSAWNDVPPATQPTLPPIRSVTTTTPNQSASNTGPTRAVQTVPDYIQRDMTSAMDASPLDAQPSSPLIIPGSGRPANLHPAISRPQPRSHTMHIALIALTTCLIVLTLVAASPLTAGAASNHANSPFVAAGNLFAIPTATPTATPTPLPTATPVPPANYGGGNAPDPGTQAVQNQIVAVFGPYAQGALNIARCESGFHTNAWNPISILGSHAAGVFQILYPITWNSTSQRNNSPYDANANINAAYEIFVRDGYSWREWECRP